MAETHLTKSQFYSACAETASEKGIHSRFRFFSAYQIADAGLSPVGQQGAAYRFFDGPAHVAGDPPAHGQAVQGQDFPRRAARDHCEKAEVTKALNKMKTGRSHGYPRVHLPVFARLINRSAF